MIECHVEIATETGRMRTFLCHPERLGPHPVVIFFMDAPGIREELRDMARRLATVGYYVMLPNLYYRSGVEEIGDFNVEAVRTQMRAHMASLTIAAVMADTDTLIAFAETDPAASDGRIGCVGYCMSGQYAINAAARYPGRVAAAASIYGVRLVTDQPDSPHLAGRRATAEIYAGCAEHDDYAPLVMVEQFREALDHRGANTEVEIYPDVGHGFAFPQRGAYDKDAAERHWERLFALFGRTLHG